MMLKDNKACIKNIISKILVGILSGVIILGATSCGDTRWALEIEGEKLPAGVYILNQNVAIQEARENEQYDSKLKDVWDNKIDGTSVEEWVDNKAEVLTKRYYQIEKLFKEKGLELTNEDLANIEYNVENIWGYFGAKYEKLGISKDSLEKSMINSLKENKLFKLMYDKDGEKAVGDDDLKKYYADKYIKVNIASYSTKNSPTGESVSDDKKKELENKANEDLNRIKNGENIKTIIKERKDATGSNSTQNSENGQATEEPTEESTQVLINKDGKNSISDELTKQIVEKAVVGDVVLLSDENGYYIVKSYGSELSDDELNQKRDSILREYKYEEFTKDIDEQAKSLKVTENKNAISAFKPQKWDEK